jgi:hypothetical protein
MLIEKSLLQRIAEGMAATLMRLFALLMSCLGIDVRPRPPALADRAGDLVDLVEKAPARREKETVVKMLNPSLGIRTRQAAEAMSRGQSAPPAWLNPDVAIEKKILDWLERNRLDALSAIASARPVPLEAHVNGSKNLPGLPPMDQAPASEPYDEQEWISWLVERQIRIGNDDPDIDVIERQARALAGRRMSPTDVKWQIERL